MLMNLRKFTTASVSLATLLTLVACAAPSSVPRAPTPISTTIVAPTEAPTIAPAEIPTIKATTVVTSTEPITSTTAMTNTAAANKAVIERFYDEVANKHNVAAIPDLMDPNTIDHEYGRLEASESDMFNGLPDLKTTALLWVVEGDLVVALVNLKGTHTGTFLGVAATGKPVDITYVDIWRVKDGKINEVWHNFPLSDIVAQISPPSTK